MPSCLGIYIENELIKYAKVSKDHNKFKVEAYGVKFYDTDIEKVLDQIVEETYSFQIPISINIGKEHYTYSNVFSLLKPQDLEKTIETEFEFFCNNNNKNKNTIEYRYLKTINLEDRDKARIIYAYLDKVNIVERLQLLDKYKTKYLFPIATIVPNLNKVAMQDNSIIVNIENETEITTIVNGKVYKIDKIEQGMGKILKGIAERESSTQRAYEICKNTTVYTKTGQNLKIEGNEYLDEIITSLLEIIEKVKENVANSELDINNIYITGMGLIINNIDLLFQESFIDKKCEILVPDFIEKTNVKINIKDYIEVNSAISLAIQGLDIKNQATNFNDSKNTLQAIWGILNSDLGKGNNIFKSKKTKRQKVSFKDAMHSELDMTDKMLLRLMTTLLLIIILYIGSTEALTQKINEKTKLADKVIAETDAQIAKVQQYSTLINTRTTEYQNMIDKIDEANSRVSDGYSSKNAIPNFLTKVMFNIPKGVQLLSIENSSGKNITITARSDKYDQLGYFKAALDEEGILTNITTTKGVKQDDGSIDIIITGQLPY